MKNTILKASFIAMTLAVLSGCATTQQINEIRAIAEGARSSASNASSQASSATFQLRIRHYLLPVLLKNAAKLILVRSTVLSNKQ